MALGQRPPVACVLPGREDRLPGQRFGRFRGRDAIENPHRDFRSLVRASREHLLHRRDDFGIVHLPQFSRRGERDHGFPLEISSDLFEFGCPLRHRRLCRIALFLNLNHLLPTEPHAPESLIAQSRQQGIFLGVRRQIQRGEQVNPFLIGQFLLFAPVCQFELGGECRFGLGTPLAIRR